jgi:hypothetical protein
MNPTVGTGLEVEPKPEPKRGLLRPKLGMRKSTRLSVSSSFLSS